MYLLSCLVFSFPATVWYSMLVFDPTMTTGKPGRVNCPCLEQGRNPNSQPLSAISASILPIEPQDHNQPTHRNPEWFGDGLQGLLVKLEQILEQYTGKLTVQILALFGIGAVYPILW